MTDCVSAQCYHVHYICYQQHFVRQANTHAHNRPRLYACRYVKPSLSRRQLVIFFVCLQWAAISGDLICMMLSVEPLVTWFLKQTFRPFSAVLSVLTNNTHTLVFLAQQCAPLCILFLCIVLICCNYLKLSTFAYVSPCLFETQNAGYSRCIT